MGILGLVSGVLILEETTESSSWLWPGILGLVSEEFDRSVWGFTSIASAVWLFKRENVRAAHLDGLLFPFGPQTDNPRIYRLSAVGP